MSSTVKFQCPNCRAVLKAPAGRAGEKIHCLRCNQRLQIPQLPPPPPPPSSKTILAPVVGVPQSAPPTDGILNLPPSAIAGPAPFGQPAPPTAGANPLDFTDTVEILPNADQRPAREPQKHSGLGIASFLMGLLVGGMELLLAFVTALGMTGGTRQQIAGSLVGGAMSMLCLAFLCVPVCLVGAGLGGVAIVAHRDRNHLFSWMGLFINGIIIAALVAVYVAATVWANHQPQQPRF